MKTLDEYKAMLCEKAKFTLSPQTVKVSAYQVMDQMLQDFEKECTLESTVCSWSLDDEEMNTYKTGCGQYFNLETETPKENDILFCPYCGGSLEQTKDNRTGSSSKNFDDAYTNF